MPGMSSMSNIQEIEVLIRARYPILYLVTNEEQRAQSMIEEIAHARQKRLLEWSCNTGMTPAGASIQTARQRNTTTREPLAALDMVIEQVEPALFVFKDFHPYLSRQHFTVIRKLKEIAIHLKNSQKTIVLISPVLELPPELDKEITVIHIDPPNADELGVLLDRIVREVCESRQARLELDAVSRERLLQAALGLTLGEAENVFAKILVKTGGLGSEHISEVLSEKRQIIRRSGLLEYYDSTEDFSRVGGLNLLKDWLRKRTVAFTEQARDFGLPVPKGILLLGVQGCGKSLCAKAVSSLWQLPLLRFDMGKMFNSLVGSSEENVRKAISLAESVSPAILWVDEIDKAFAGSQASGMTDGGTTARVFGTFLTWLSEKSAPVFVVATANDIAQLPPELLRKGRLDEIFFVNLPDIDERMEIFSIHLLKRGRDPVNFDLRALAESAVDFSGAEIQEAVISALYDAFYDSRDVTTGDILNSLRQTYPLARTMDAQIDRIRDWAHGRARNASGEAAGELPAQTDLPMMNPVVSNET